MSPDDLAKLRELFCTAVNALPALIDEIERLSKGQEGLVAAWQTVLADNDGLRAAIDFDRQLRALTRTNAMSLIEQRTVERDTALAALVDCDNEIKRLHAALSEACDLASPFTTERSRSMMNGYASELRPMFVRIGATHVDERVAELRALVKEEADRPCGKS